MNDSSQRCSLNAIATHMQANSRCSTGYQQHQSPTRPRGIAPAGREPSLTQSTLKSLQTWWVQALRQAEVRGKQPIVCSDESDTEPEGVYWYTRTRIGVIDLVDYSALGRDSEVSESHSVIAESQASNYSIEKKVFTYMARTPEEMARHFE